MPETLGSWGCRAGLVALELVRHHLTGDLCRRLALQESGGPPTIGIHQPGQADFRSVLPEDIDWRPFPAFPPSARLTVVFGEPSEPGPYVIRVKLPSGVKLIPHQHSEDRVYTVISGCLLRRFGKPVRRRTAAGLPARRRHRAPRRYPPFPLGEVRNLRHPNDGYRTAWSRIHRLGRRPAKPVMSRRRRP
jgi:hypothetical protein